MLRLYRAVIDKMQQAGLPTEIIDKILIESRHITLCWLHSEYALEQTCEIDTYYEPKEIARYNKLIIKDVIWFRGVNHIDLLLESIRINHYKLFKYLLKYEVDEITDIMDLKYGITDLSYEITELKYEIMDLIAEHNRKKMFITMLHVFAINGINCNIFIIRSIYEYNRVGFFKILLSEEYYPSGRNYLVDTVFEEGSSDIVDFILTHKLYDLKHDLEEDLLLQIIREDHFALFEMLVKRRHLHNADFSYNNNCLIKAAVTNYCYEIVKSLLDLPSAYGIDVMASDNNIDLIQITLNNNDIHILALLLERVSQNKKDIKKFKKNYKLLKYDEIKNYDLNENMLYFIDKILNLIRPY